MSPSCTRPLIVDVLKSFGAGLSAVAVVASVILVICGVTWSCGHVPHLAGVLAILAAIIGIWSVGHAWRHPASRTRP